MVLGWHCHVSARYTHILNVSSAPTGICSCFDDVPFFFFHRYHCSDSSYSLLADDVLGSFLLCPHPKKPKCGSLIVRFPSGLVTHLVENTRKGKFLLAVNVFVLFSGKHDNGQLKTLLTLFFCSLWPKKLNWVWFDKILLEQFSVFFFLFLFSMTEMQARVWFHRRADWALHQGRGQSALSAELCPSQPLLWVGGI